ncbi:Protein CBG27218 [Caenorhabditis briggsae]|uniref:Protein CBG27218 n=1 Tax=Caenorhabditis briggsae TaxID=6238 RepID=B6IFU1_CAEBR|nr:Protein CBG27218 [Caenorhabditis briggsae]CAR98757.1 Protein CBG27218 [Caenorhabditis briggsae]
MCLFLYNFPFFSNKILE